MNDLKDVKVLAFDVFGTVVDWHGSIAAEVKRLQLDADPAVFARAWRAGYKPAMARVMSGELGWTKIDRLHRIILDQVLDEFNINLNESSREELNLIWHRLSPWSDSVEGLTRLRKKYTICTLSNGNLSLLSNMAKNAGLPWDLILSAEVFKAYKPHPDTYLGVAGIFDLQPGQVMLVAAHHDDLESAGKCGLRTAYIERPTEFGIDQLKDLKPPPGSTNDLHLADFNALADALNADEKSGHR